MAEGIEGASDGTPSPIRSFFQDSKVFVTGGTGFLGMLLLEKLLFSCFTSTIYILIRSKKGKTVEDRLDGLFEDAIFFRVKEQYPNFREKIVPIEGDCELPGLGINTQDRVTLINEVNVVFHLAATVRFEETLKKASFINVRAVRDLVRLAQQMNNLKSFIHVSTAYSNSIHSTIKEEVYPPSMDYNKLLIVTEGLPTDDVDSITPRLLGKYPNTYTFTKQIAEDVIVQEGRGLPIGIHRPSIVTSTHKEPLKGWINNFYGPCGFVVGSGVGIIRAVHIKSEKKSNMVPADMVVNSVIAAAWDTAEKFSEDLSVRSPPVYNFEADQAPVLTWREYRDHFVRLGNKYCTVKAVWYMYLVQCSTKVGFEVTKFFLHTIPAVLLDSVRFCIGKPPAFLKVYQKIDKMFGAFKFFMHQEWNFVSDNVTELKSRMSIEDQTTFYCDMKDFDWAEYLESSVIGFRLYLVKDPLDTVPEGQRWFRKLYWMHHSLNAVLASIFLWVLWCLLSFVLN